MTTPSASLVIEGQDISSRKDLDTLYLHYKIIFQS